jgi:exopolysaccharide biosynthesis WecB/TagA/CpsF family protein
MVLTDVFDDVRQAGTSAMPTIEVLGVEVAAMDRCGALDEVERLLDGPDAAWVGFVNAHSLNLACENDAYRDALDTAELVLNDGAGLALAARLNGRQFPDNLNGTDFTPQLLQRAAQGGHTVFLFGARPGVAEAAALRLAADIPGLVVAGTADGYTLSDDEVVAKVRASGADVLLVAMGNPIQELWLAEHLADTGARLGVAVGAFLDFTAGRVQRAPLWMRRSSLEWLYRLAIEPRRMFRRYVLGNPKFVVNVLRARLATA